MKTHAMLMAMTVMLAGGVTGARAQTPGPPTFLRLLYLQGQGAEGCPRPEAFETAVSRRLGRFPFSEVSGNLLIVLLERDPGSDPQQSFQGRFFLRDEHGMTTGERRLRLRPCTAVVEALAVAVSVLLTPPTAAPTEAALAAAAPTPMAVAPPTPEGQLAPVTEPPAADGPPAAGLRQVAPRPTSDREDGPPSRWQLGVGSMMVLLGDDGTNPGFRLSLGRMWRQLALVMDAQTAMPQKRNFGRGSVHSFGVTAGLAPCRRWGRGLVCAELRSGLVNARAQGFDDNDSMFRPTAAAGLRAGYEVGNGRLRLRAHVWVEASLLRWQFMVDEAVALKQRPLGAGLGFEVLAGFL
jgi:hypothetical protein